MHRYYEYTDEDGKRWGAMQNIPGDNVPRSVGNRLLSETARMSRWKDVEVFPEKMPEWQVKKRINAIQEKNGNPKIYADEETTDPALRPVVSIPHFTLTDHADNTTIETPIMATSAARPMPEPIYAPGVPQPVQIVDHAAPQPTDAG